MKHFNGWPYKYKRRHGIASHNLHGEASDADAQGVALARVQLLSTIGMYNSKDVFNFDEIGTYYRAPPAKTLKIG